MISTNFITLVGREAFIIYWFITYELFKVLKVLNVLKLLNVLSNLYPFYPFYPLNILYHLKPLNLIYSFNYRLLLKALLIL